MKQARLLTQQTLDDEGTKWQFNMNGSYLMYGTNIEQFDLGFSSDSLKINEMLQSGEGSERLIPASDFICDKPYRVQAFVSDGDFYESDMVTFIPNAGRYFVMSDTETNSSEEIYEFLPGSEPIEIEMTLVEDAEAGCDGSAEFDRVDVEVVLRTSDGTYLAV